MADAVLDLDALDNEANGVPFTFKSGGQTFSMEAGEDSDWRVLDALDKGDLAQAFRFLLGDEQYEKFASRKVSMRTFKRLLNEWAKFKGDVSGEDSDSSTS
jgi:hypothetical protein